MASAPDKILSIDELRAAAAPLAVGYRFKAVTLFGSYACGKATPNSDIDVVVVYDGEPDA